MRTLATSLCLALVLTGCGADTTNRTRLPTIRHIVAFGDSLTDTGDAGHERRRPFRRCTDGPTWVALLAAEFEVALDCRAEGGATTRDVLEHQVADYLAATPTVPPDTLVVLWAGGNDLLCGAATTAPEQLATAAAQRLVTTIERLAAAGARCLLVPDLPDLALLPKVRQLGPIAVRRLADASREFDLAVDAALAAAALPRDLAIVRVDVRRLIDGVVARPAEHGIVNATAPASRDGRRLPAADCGAWLFWDATHPTSAGHRLIAQRAVRALASRAGPR